MYDYAMNAPVYRFPGRPVKVGIRPAIDGRLGGVREGLEAQTMDMAHAAARLIEQKLRHPNGMSVECVIADTTIGGVAEAAACAEKFTRENVGVSLTVSPCWCYGSETMDMDPLMPKAVWGFNGTERPGAVYLAAVMAAHNMKGLPAFAIYGHDVQDAHDMTIPADVEEKLLRFVRCGLAAAWMRGKSYLSIGGVSMGIAGSILVPGFFEEYLGMRVESIDMSEVFRRIRLRIYDTREYHDSYQWAKENFHFGSPDLANSNGCAHSPEQQEKALETSLKMMLVIRDLMEGNPKLKRRFGEESKGHNALVAGFQGQRQWTDSLPNGDLAEAILCSSFGPWGIAQPRILATENDSLNATSMLLGHLLTGAASVFADVRTFWSPEAVFKATGQQLTGDASHGIIHLINSGPAALDGTGMQKNKEGSPTMKPWWEVTSTEANECMKAVEWCYGDLGYFRGGGYSTRFASQGGMPVTMVRINLVKGLGPVMQLAEGWTVSLPWDVHQVLDMRTNPSWPTTWFAPKLIDEGAFTDVYSVMANWGANHGALHYGHIGDELITLASMLRIPVSLHNVERERILRPSAWAAFGTADPEGADYRACKAFGPLYTSIRGIE